jgi:hypothetical protein
MVQVLRGMAPGLAVASDYASAVEVVEGVAALEEALQEALDEE